MEPDWINIINTNKTYLAEMAKDILEENNIDIVIMNNQDSIYLIGDIDVYTKPEDVIRAKFLLKELK